MSEVSEKTEIRILDMKGGEKDNSIPVNAMVRFLVFDSKKAGEVIYEVANRPDWLEIPMNGLSRLVNLDGE